MSWVKHIGAVSYDSIVGWVKSIASYNSDLIWYKRIVGYYEKLEDYLSMFTGVVLLALTIIIVLGVIMRYVFDSPLSWVMEVAPWFVIGIVFLPQGFLQQAGRHLKVDAVSSRLSAKKQTKLRAATLVLSLFVFIIFFYSMALYAKNCWVGDWRLQGVDWQPPLFPVIVVIPICIFIIILQICIGLARDISTLLAERKGSAQSSEPAMDSDG